MSETPKSEASHFEFIDRRKLKAQEEQTAESEQAAAPEHAPAQPAPQPRSPAEKHPGPETRPGPRLVEDSRALQEVEEEEAAPELPPAPSAKESNEQKAAYEASAQRIEEMARAQNPAMGAQPPLGFEHLIQQFYLSALIQMGAGAHEGQRPQVDILGARSTIDLLGILAEKTRGNLTPAEDRMLQSILYELRMMFLEITGMISMPQVPQPPPAKR